MNDLDIPYLRGEGRVGMRGALACAGWREYCFAHRWITPREKLACEEHWHAHEHWKAWQRGVAGMFKKVTG
jgi:hypothetical protein